MRILDRLPFILDGSTGVVLKKRGMPQDVCAEKWHCDNPGLFTALVAEYAAAGCDAVLVPGFSASPIKLARYGLEAEAYDINYRLTRLTREAAGGAKVLCDMAVTGEFVSPAGEGSVAKFFDSYIVQARACADAGADGAFIETQISAADFRAAAMAAKAVGLPFMITVTLEQNGRTLTGCRPECAAIIARGLGAEAVGLNCCDGPERIMQFIGGMYEVAGIPIIAKPNAGMPDPVSGEYAIGEREFCGYIERLVGMGVSVVGGCCGTGPDYIRLLDEKIRAAAVKEPAAQKSYICSETEYVCIEGGLADGGVKCAAIRDEADAESFLEETAFDKTPVCIRCDEYQLAERVLREYNGIAALDSRLCAAEVEALSERYGCVIVSGGAR